MRHSFISWDCSFRNFFHLADALWSQDYDLSQVELIFVEQRSREQADAYNHAAGLPSLSDRQRDFPDSFFRPLYMDDPPTAKYHLGRTLNYGMKKARGAIVTVMDGDLLLPSDFIRELDRCHALGEAVVNVERKMCPGPVGASLDDWTKGQFDYESCLGMCGKASHIPNYVINKGPMISASARSFNKIAGYDEHSIFSTGLSRAGQDTNTRLELATGCKSCVIPRVAVHPYHPQGFSRQTLDAVRILNLQARIIKHTRRYNCYDWRDRAGWLEAMVSSRSSLVTRVHEKDYTRTSWRWLHQSMVIGKFYKWLGMAFMPFRP